MGQVFPLGIRRLHPRTLCRRNGNVRCAWAFERRPREIFGRILRREDRKCILIWILEKAFIPGFDFQFNSRERYFYFARRDSSPVSIFEASLLWYEYDSSEIDSSIFLYIYIIHKNVSHFAYFFIYIYSKNSFVNDSCHFISNVTQPTFVPSFR